MKNCLSVVFLIVIAILIASISPINAAPPAGLYAEPEGA